jgi:hypothetical protein
VGSVVERAVDFVKAAVAQRSQLGGGLSLDEHADLAPSAAPVAAGTKRGAGESGAAMEEEGAGEDRRKRSRRGEDGDEGPDLADDTAGGEEAQTGMDAAQAAADQEEEDDPLWLADEALKSALRNSRAVFATVTGECRQTVASQVAEEGADAMYVAASLLRRTLRVFRGAELHLSHSQQTRAVLTAPDAQLHALLVQVGGGATAGVSAQRWLAQLRR